jgi:dihydroflavonol-4-reductase
MRIAITGASGLLGGNLAVEACAAGHTVVATRRGSSRIRHLEHLPIEWVEADLGDAAGLTRAFSGCEQVYHVAAVVSVRRSPTSALVSANVDGTDNVLRAVAAAGRPRLVHTSSAVTIGLSEDGRPCDETARFNFGEHGMLDGYVITKREAEVRVLASDLDVVVVNPTYMLGPYDSKPSSGKILVELARGGVPGNSSGGNNFVDVRDVARGMLLAGARGRDHERYILGGTNMPYAEAFTTFCRAMGVAPPRFTFPRWLAAFGGWAGDLQERLTDAEPVLNSVTVGWGYCTNYQFTSAKAERELGYTHGPIEPAVIDAIAWMRANGMV